MKRITIIVLLVLSCLLCVQCVSLEKYRALESDYQRCGDDQRSYEQLIKQIEADKKNGEEKR